MAAKVSIPFRREAEDIYVPNAALQLVSAGFP